MQATGSTSDLKKERQAQFLYDLVKDGFNTMKALVKYPLHRIRDT